MVLDTMEFKSRLNIGLWGILFVMMLAFGISVLLSLGIDINSVVMCLAFVIMGLLFLTFSNYVILEKTGMEIKNPYLPFMNVRIFYSDVESVSLDESYAVLKIARKDYGKTKVCRRRIFACSNLSFFHAYLKAVLPPEKLL